MIYAIQDLRNKHIGMAWDEFSGFTHKACEPQWRNKNGEPSQQFLGVAAEYTRQLKQAQDFIDLSKNFIPTL